MNILKALYLASLSWIEVAQSQNIPWFYELSSPAGEKAWLYGSIHAGDSSMYPIHPQILRAFENSKSLVVEVDAKTAQPISPEQLAQLAYRTDSIKNPLSSTSIEKWLELTKEMNLGPILEIQRPWSIGVFLLQFQLSKVKLNASLGIDEFFNQRAQLNKKHIFSLENPETQLKALASLPDSLGWRWIDQELKYWEEGQEQGKLLISAWKSGDCKTLKAIEGISSVDSLLNQTLQNWFDQNLLKKRNYPMSDSIQKWVQLGRHPFVVVGAAHLCDQNGLPEIFKRKGWKVSPVISTIPKSLYTKPVSK